MRRRNESGQAAVLFAILMGVMIVIVAATTNMGKLVTEKMAMQNAVDLAVYSGAATQAGHLNRMRKINHDAWQELYNARQDTLNDTIGNPLFFSAESSGPDCSTVAAANVMGLNAEYQEGVYFPQLELKMLDYKTRIKEINTQGPQDAYQAAKSAADQNYPGTGDKLEELHPASGGGLMNLSEGEIEISYHAWCLQSPPVPPVPVRATWVKTHRIQSWEFKDDVGQVMYAAKISAAPDSPFMEVGQKYFTPKNCEFGTMMGNRCTLDVYAVAEPYHGKLGSILNGKGGAFWESTPFMWNFSDRIPKVMNDQPALLDAHKVKGAMYLDYEVRFVGIFEQQMLLIGNGDTIQDKVDSVSGGYGQYMEH